MKKSPQQRTHRVQLLSATDVAQLLDDVIEDTGPPRHEDTSSWKCRGCGCTNARACPDGCSWVEKDLCTRCLAWADNFTGAEVITLANALEAWILRYPNSGASLAATAIMDRLIDAGLLTPSSRRSDPVPHSRSSASIRGSKKS